MNLKEIAEKVTQKTAEAGKQRGEISRKLEANKREKATAEAAKIAALDAKDEQAYKDACRVIADSEAGIEFNTICLNTLSKQQYATAEENRDIKQAMRKEMVLICSEVFSEIEKAFNTISKAAGLAMEKLSAIESLNQLWDDDVMKDSNTKTSICSDKLLILSQYKSRADSSLHAIELTRNNNPDFRKGVK